jgi:spore coat polysaccharide biosynthesis predicted glycosyltransferase SpsG
MENRIIEIKGLIQEKLESFIQVMYEWEVFSEKIGKDKSLSSEEKIKRQKEPLIKIFEKYCTKKDRKYGRPNIVHYGGEGYYEYDLNEEKIKNIEQKGKNKIIVFTERNNPMKQMFQYIFVNKNDNWLIDTKKKANFEGTAWVNRSL